MTEEVPVKYTTWIVIMVIVGAIAISILYTVYKSEEAFRLLRDILYWIPGMDTVVRMFGGITG